MCADRWPGPRAVASSGTWPPAVSRRVRPRCLTPTCGSLAVAVAASVTPAPRPARSQPAACSSPGRGQRRRCPWSSSPGTRPCAARVGQAPDRRQRGRTVPDPAGEQRVPGECGGGAGPSPTPRDRAATLGSLSLSQPPSVPPLRLETRLFFCISSRQRLAGLLGPTRCPGVGEAPAGFGRHAARHLAGHRRCAGGHRPS